MLSSEKVEEKQSLLLSSASRWIIDRIDETADNSFYSLTEML